MEKKELHFERIAILFLPYLVALFFSNDPVLSYFIAWLGSFMIFFVTLNGWIRPLPDDLPFSEQIMRPIILVQLIFAGYMCCTSIFYLMNAFGYENFVKTTTYFLVDQHKLSLIAKCQQYYVLGHASFVSGILVFMNYPEKKKYKFNSRELANFLLYSAVIALPVSIFFSHFPPLYQFQAQFESLSFIAGSLALAFAIPQRKMINTVICLFLYFSNFYAALTSGYKEPIILSLMVLGIFLYPSYKKIVILTFVPLLILFFTFLPTYARIFRQSNWEENTSVDEATQLALSTALSSNTSIEDTNWFFLVYRLSEIDMFSEFLESTPTKIDFYGTDILKQAAIAIIPRAFWPGKPNTEELVMERVYLAGVINRNSTVSAKPAFVVDAYLSGGTVGIIIALFLYGAIAQLIAKKAEYLFGGYLLGTAFIFSGLFQIFWRGLSFEFIINSVFWSYITMIIIHKIMISRGILQEV